MYPALSFWYERLVAGAAIYVVLHGSRSPRSHKLTLPMNQQINSR